MTSGTPLIRLVYAFLWFGCAIPVTLFAQEFSPFSPAFILERGAVQSSTSLGVNWYNGQSSTTISNGSQKISSVAGSEFLSVGLPNDIQVGVGIAYSDWVSKSPSTLNVGAGFSNPNLFAKKVWFGDTDARLNLTLGVAPNTENTGLRGLGTRYNAGLAGVFILDQSLVGTFGATQFVSDKNGAYQTPNETQLSGAISKAFDFYLVNFALRASRFDSQLITQGYRQSNYGLGGNLQLSRQFATNVWGAIAYDISGSNSTFVYGANDYRNKNLNNSLLTTVNILF